jgi:translation initiation factor 2A
MTNEFMMIIGMMPATTKLFDGKTGKMFKEGQLGTSRRNAIRWNPFGRFVCVGGFGALPGDLDFFDNSAKETLCSFRAALTVNCCWGPSGRHFLTCTTTPRMNEDNQISIWHYNTGDLIVKLDYRPQGALRTGGGAEGGRAAADAGAMLYAASWRPDGKGAYKDRAASPVPAGKKRVKGLKVDDLKTKEGGGAYRPKGGGGFSGVAAMMRGELEVPSNAPAVGGGWELKGDAPPAKPLTWQEQEQQAKEWAKEKKALAKKEKADEEEAKQAKKDELKAIADKIKGGDKRLADLKAQLAELDKIKDKEWDELTDEDEAELEKEIEIKALIAELEKGK